MSCWSEPLTDAECGKDLIDGRKCRSQMLEACAAAAVYGLKAGADTHFSRAYPAVLSGVVRTPADQLKPKQMESILHETGRRIADSLPALSGNAQERVEGAV